MPKQKNLYLDRAERNFLEKLKKKNPAYADLEISDIAHLELKSRLAESLQKIAKASAEN